MKKIIMLVSLFSFAGVCASENFLSKKWGKEIDETVKQLDDAILRCSGSFHYLLQNPESEYYFVCSEREVYLRVKWQSLRLVGGIADLYPTRINNVEELSVRMHEEIDLIPSDFIEKNMYRSDHQKIFNSDKIDKDGLHERIKKELHDLVNKQ